MGVTISREERERIGDNREVKKCLKRQKKEGDG